MATLVSTEAHVEREHNKRIPVVEIFGPTIQGEGPDQGQPCHFVRFGGCDYKCDWCDSPHAVLPHLVRQVPRLTPQEIVDRVESLIQGPKTVVLSGGNPVLHDLTDLVYMLHYAGYRVAVETQGTRWQSWLWSCDRVVVSPKPPSSQMPFDQDEFDKFMGMSRITDVLKVVVFDSADYEFARNLHKRYPGYKMFLSAGNDAGSTVSNPSRVDARTHNEVARDLIGHCRWLINWTMVDRDMQDVQVQMQTHVLLWGNERGR